MVFLMNPETSSLYCRVTPEMFFVRDALPEFLKNAFLAVFPTNPVIEDAEKSYCLTIVFKYVCDSKKLTKIIKSVFLKEFIQVGIATIKRFYS